MSASEMLTPLAATETPVAEGGTEPTQPVEPGQQLVDALQRLVSECAESRCCAIGVANLTDRPLHDPKYFTVAGIAVREPCASIPDHKAVACLFAKVAGIKGSSGVLTFEIDPREDDPAAR
eukprot:TRINITY_DN2842_c0_g1_i2.p2 TRINITY_DN2842_c0_g1~~TRINITY_DN2842_c0_g1_i2.p2  ORF type:complete len:121 (+),score=36.67 TRINITY_DN2842_c0_g1_i2:108-470(+)